VALIHGLEKLAIRAYWLARIASEMGVDGQRWQDILFKTAHSCQPYARIQGPGSGKLFGRCGAAGMSSEVDVALDDGKGYLALVEGKAHADYSLGRDPIFVFDGKVRDYERTHRHGWNGIFALLASAGRLDAVTVRWCFACGIDVVDPDRMPLAVLARVAELFPRAAERLSESHLHEYLVDALSLDAVEHQEGPVLLRRPSRTEVLVGERLGDLNLIQSRLSEDLFHALTGIEPGSSEAQSNALWLRVTRELKHAGLQVESRYLRGPGSDQGKLLI
jgi:hypothetical protein